MEVIDLSHMIVPDMPVYPGMEQPVMESACCIEKNGFWEKKITIYSHTGTHMDAPAHIIPGAATLDTLPVSHFCGTACVVDVATISGNRIERSMLLPHEQTIREVDFLVIRTGWDRYWGMDRYFVDYPVLTVEAAEWLGKCMLKGIGIDAISVDDTDSHHFPVHRALLKADTVIIENLTDIGKIPGGVFFISCFPLRLDNADGSPVRAVAFLQ